MLSQDRYQEVKEVIRERWSESLYQQVRGVRGYGYPGTGVYQDDYRRAGTDSAARF